MGTPITQANITGGGGGVTWVPDRTATNDLNPDTYLLFPEASGATQAGYGFDLAGTYTGTRVDIEWETLGGDCLIEWYVYILEPYAEVGGTGATAINLAASPSGTLTIGDEHIQYDPSGLFAGGFSAQTFLERVATGVVEVEVFTASATAGFRLTRFQFVVPGRNRPHLRQYPRSPLRKWPPERSVQRSLRQGPGAFK